MLQRFQVSRAVSPAPARYRDRSYGKERQRASVYASTPSLPCKNIGSKEHATFRGKFKISSCFDGASGVSIHFSCTGSSGTPF
jgi:hypothetical protein